MGKVILTDTYLSNIADAIRTKSSTQVTYTPPQMAQAILDIPAPITVTSLSVTENGTYTAQSGSAYSPITVNVPTVTITQSGSNLSIS